MGPGSWEAGLREGQRKRPHQSPGELGTSTLLWVPELKKVNFVKNTDMGK